MGNNLGNSRPIHIGHLIPNRRAQVRVLPGPPPPGNINNFAAVGHFLCRVGPCPRQRSGCWFSCVTPPSMSRRFDLTQCLVPRVLVAGFRAVGRQRRERLLQLPAVPDHAGVGALGPGIRPSRTISSKSDAETPTYSAATMRRRPRGGNDGGSTGALSLAALMATSCVAGGVRPAWTCVISGSLVEGDYRRPREYFKLKRVGSTKFTKDQPRQFKCSSSTSVTVPSQVE
jgi:hypothetical protein